MFRSTLDRPRRWNLIFLWVSWLGQWECRDTWVWWRRTTNYWLPLSTLTPSSCSNRAPSCRRLSVHLPAAPGLLAGLARPRWPASVGPTWRISGSAGRSRLRSHRLYLVSSRLTRYSSACHATQAQSDPAHRFRFTCWTSVNKMSTVSSSARIRGGEGS